MNRTIMGDVAPTTRAWMLLLTNKIDLSDEAFADVASWSPIEWDNEFAIEVIYRSGRDEVYTFSSDCVAGGMYFGPTPVNEGDNNV